jgi:hypothetical protein
MSAGLLNQLESYFSEVDTDQGPVSPDQVAELIDQVREVVPAPVPVAVRSRSRVWVAAAAFAIVLVLIGGLALIAPFGGDSVAPADQPAPTVPETDEPAPTVPRTDVTFTIVPTDDTTDAVVDLPLDIVWTEITAGDVENPVDDPIGYGLQTNVGIAVYGDSYVVPPKVCRLGACDWFISDDGLEWRTEPVPVDPPDGDTDYFGWVSDETVWFIEEGLEDGRGFNPPLGIGDRVDPPGHLKILHNDGASWVEDRWVPPAGAENGLSILGSHRMGTCLINVSDEGMVFDLGYQPTEGESRIMVGRSSNLQAIPHPADINQTCTAGFVNGTLYALASSTNGQDQSQHFRRWDGDQWIRLPDPEGVGETVPIDTAGGAHPPRFTGAAIEGGRAFVGVADGTLWTTTDFETWTLTDPLLYVWAGGIRTAAYGWTAPSEDSRFFYVSADGIAWTTIEKPTAAFCRLSYANGVFASVEVNGVWIGIPSQT